MFVILIPFEQFCWTFVANVFPPPLYGIKVEHAEVTNMDFFYNGQKKKGGGGVTPCYFTFLKRLVSNASFQP